MSRNPRLILDDLVAFARQFRWHEQRLVDQADFEDPSSIDVKVFEIEQGFSGAAFRFVWHFQEYKVLAGGRSCNGFDLPLMFSVKDVSEIPTKGKALVIVAAVDHRLHFRLFDRDGRKLVDTYEVKLSDRAGPFDDLKKQLVDLWPPRELSATEKDRLVSEVTSI